MKTCSLGLIIIILNSYSALAQNTFPFPESGYVGIGTTTPGSRLTVKDAIRVSTSDGLGGFYASDAAIGGNSIFSFTRQGNDLAISAYDGLGFSTAARSGPSTIYNMFIDQIGNIGIGTLDTKGYKLAISGSVIAESVTVKLKSNWPDYVFNRSYPLPTLASVKLYIDKNHHLPDMPTAGEIAKEGVNLGEINKLLAKKLEELTLYLIEKDSQVKSLQQQVQKLNEQMNKLLMSKNK